MPSISAGAAGRAARRLVTGPVAPMVVTGLVGIAHLIQLTRSPLLRYLTVDLEAYDAWARRIAAGDWLGPGVFYQDPLYPYVMGVLYALTGTHFVSLYSPVLRLPLLQFGWLLPLAALGGALVLWRRPSTRAALFVGLVLAYIAAVVAFFIFSRYRFPIVPALVILAAYGVIELIEAARLQQWRTVGGGALVATVAAVLVTLPPTVSPAADLSHRSYNLAASYYQAGRLEEAAQLGREALRVDPRNGLALLTLAKIAEIEGNAAAADSLLLQAARARPGDEEIVAELARSNARRSGPESALSFLDDWLSHRESYLLRKTGIEMAEQAGRLDDAAARLRALLEIYPGDEWGRTNADALNAPDSKAARGAAARQALDGTLAEIRSLIEGRRFDEAESRLDAALHADSLQAPLYQYLSNLFYLRGDIVRARAALAKALALDPDNPLYKSNLRALDRESNRE